MATYMMAMIFCNTSSSPPLYLSPLTSTRPKPSRFSKKFIVRAQSQSQTMEDDHLRRKFMEFPYVSTMRRQIMVDLMSTIEERLESQLLPCSLPDDVRNFKNPNGSAEASLHIRSGEKLSPNKFLSHGGKEVLLKSVAFAIPTYAMSCYLLPKGMLQRLNQEFSRFWWKNQQTGKGIHWVSWDKLIQSKKKGGMGFRNIEGFNIALLGKQLWRLLEHPNSLLARTFKARYFPDTSILQAHLGSRPSYGWRSLLASQPMMLHGLKKEIGDGRSLDMWSDPWILDAKPRPPRAKPHIDRSEWTVADFKEDMGDQWDINLLKQVIETEDVPRILSIKPGGLDSAAGYSWIYNDKGFYSVKSGYKLWECLHSQEQGQVPEQQPNYSSIFEKVWNNGTSSKLKHFIWKCLTSSIAIGTELRKRTLTNDATCQVCGQADEDALHLFFECAFARLVWAQSPYASIISDSSCSIQGRIYSCFMLSDNLDEEYKHLWTWILWRIWKVRNELVYQGRAPNAQQAYNMSCSDSLEWRTNLNAARSSPLSLIVSDDKRWVPPPMNFVKCNTDATWQDNHDRCGISWILRNHTGAVIFWGIKTYPKLLSPLDAEATALVWATSCLKNMGYDNIIFESDSSSLIEAVHDPGSRPRLLIYSSEIQGRMIRNDWQIRFEKISRNGNMAADALAKYAKDFPLYHGYLDNRIPLWLTPFLDIDFVIGSWIHCKIPTGISINITSISGFLNPSTKAPNFVVELIQSTPTSLVLILDLPHRKDLVLNPDYLKEYYQDTALDSHRQSLLKLPEVKPYVSPSLFVRSAFSPTASMLKIDTEDEEKLEEILRDHVSVAAKEVLGVWLERCVREGGEKRVVGEEERMELERRDKSFRKKSIEEDLDLQFPRMFGEEVSSRVVHAIKEAFGVL